LFPSFIQRKIATIDENRDKQNVKTLLEGINNESLDLSKLKQIYKSDSDSDLISKLSLSVSFYEIFLSKLNDFAFVLSLRFFNDLNDSKLYQDTYSKLFYIRNIIEKLLEREKYPEDSNLFEESMLSMVDKGIAQGSQIEESILSCKNIFDFLELQNDNTSMNHIKLLIHNYLNELKENFEDLIKQYGDEKDLKSVSGHNYKEIFIKEKLVLGKIVIDRLNEIEEMKKKLTELENLINESKNIVSIERDPEKDNPKILSLLKIIEISNNRTF